VSIVVGWVFVVGVVFIVALELVVVGEVMGTHMLGAQARVIG
jgi:hypothetical protein